MIQVTDNELDVPGVYTITHTSSGRTYVGEGLNIRTRWRGHFVALEGGYHHNPFLQRAWNKYGAEAFKFKVFLIVPRLENETDWFLKKRLKAEENKILTLFPNNFNIEVPSPEHGYVIPGPRQKRLMKKAAKKERNTPEGRARMKRVRLDAMQNPEAVKNHKLGTKAGWLDPTKKAKRIAAYNTEEGIKNRAEGATLGWIKRKEKLKNDPEFLSRHKESRAMANKKVKALYNTPERKQQLSEQSTESWKVPGRKEKVSVSLTEYYSDPANRQRQSKIMKAVHSKSETTQHQPS